VIPGARRPGQVAENVGATRMASLDAATREQVRRVYDDSIRPLVHHLW
jgi:aryl-alcohol dehydrogenase-like predicted oxidoreductase